MMEVKYEKKINPKKKNDEIYFYYKRYDYLPEKINEDQIEIFFCDAGYESLSKSNLNKNFLYLFPENFTIGDISNININLSFPKGKSIRIWSCHKNIQEYLNFLYICYKYEGKNISVIFTDEYDKNVFSVGTLRYDEISSALEHTHILSAEEISTYKKEWQKLVKENGEIRLFVDNKVKSCKYNYLYNYIALYYDKENLSKTIWYLMAYDQENNLNDETYRFLINKLFNNKDDKK